MRYRWYLSRSRPAVMKTRCEHFDDGGGRRDGSVSKKDEEEEEEEGKMRSRADNKRALNYETDFKMGGYGRLRDINHRGRKAAEG